MKGHLRETSDLHEESQAAMRSRFHANYEVAAVKLHPLRRFR